MLGCTTVYEADHRSAHDRVLVALAGPAVSLTIAVAAALVGGSPAQEIAVINLLLAGLNLIPLPDRTAGRSVPACAAGPAEARPSLRPRWPAPANWAL